MRLLGRYRWILSDCWRQKHFLPIPPRVYLLSIFRVYRNAQIPEERNEEMKRSEIMFDISCLTYNLIGHYWYDLAYSRTSFSIFCSQFVEKIEISRTIVTYQRDFGPNVWLDRILQIIKMISFKHHINAVQTLLTWIWLVLVIWVYAWRYAKNKSIIVYYLSN